MRLRTAVGSLLLLQCQVQGEHRGKESHAGAGTCEGRF